MTPDEKAWLVEFYRHTEGNYEARLSKFKTIRNTAPSIQNVTTAEFANFIGENLAAEEERNM